MKKLLNGMHAIMLIAILFISACSGESDPTIPPSRKDASAVNCYPPISGPYEFQGLNARFVYHMARNYKQKQHTAIKNANENMNDARSVWFDLETLKRFIDEVERQTCNNCTGTTTTQLGIRMYYGTYPDSSEWNDEYWSQNLQGLPESYAGRHTIMMVPTYRNTEGVNVDFDPAYITSDCNFANIDSFYQLMKSDPSLDFNFTILSAMSTTSQNHGDLIPPPYPPQSILDKGAGIMFAVDTY